MLIDKLLRTAGNRLKTFVSQGLLGCILFNLNGTALACSVVWVPYLEERPDYLFAVKAGQAWVEFTEFSNGPDQGFPIKSAGIFHLRDMRCLSRPKGEKTCPSDLDVPFEGEDDGANCGVFPQKYGPDGVVKDRYFYLLKSDQKWYVTGGARRLEEL